MTTTEVVLRDGSTTVDVSSEFASMFPALAPDPELAALLAESMDGIELTARDLPRVRVPSGGAQFWTIIRDGEETPVKELTGVLVLHKPQRVFWTNPEPSGLAPECFSVDGKRPEPGGLYAPGGERAGQNAKGLCTTCPMSAANSDLKGGRGSACKEQKLLFMICEGMMLPLVVVAPPSSLRSIQQYVINLINSGTPWWGVKTTFGLEKATNAAGNEFARIAPKAAGRLEPGEVKAVKDYSNYIKALVDAAPASEFAKDAAEGYGDGLDMGGGE